LKTARRLTSGGGTYGRFNERCWSGLLWYLIAGGLIGLVAIPFILLASVFVFPVVFVVFVE